MTLTYKLHLYFMKMYLHTKNELSRTKPSTVMTKHDISKFNTCACVMQSVQDTSVLTPSVQVEVDTVDQLFDLDSVNISTMLDKQHVTHPADYLTAVASIVCFYWVFDVAFPKQLHKTITFLAGHVCRLIPFKTVTALQKVLNHIYE